MTDGPARVRSAADRAQAGGDGDDASGMAPSYVEAVRDGDADVIHDSFSADATWHYPGDLPISKVWHGRDEIINEFLGSMGPILVPGTLEIELVSTIAEGDRVVAEWTSKDKTVYGGAYDNRCENVYRPPALRGHRRPSHLRREHHRDRHGLLPPRPDPGKGRAGRWRTITAGSLDGGLPCLFRRKSFAARC